MKHTSVKLNAPVEFINIQPLNPLISKCQIKVCYVGEDPNRNGSIITKEVAKEMANSLPGCPIVGFYNEDKEDFEEHNRVIDISNGKFEIKDTTKPYGFVPMEAKVWFQKFLDDGMVEHEYLVTEGYLWTGQYPECQRVLRSGNNQSMELDEKTLKANWSENENGGPEFFIINEAIISKLCILGEDNEPCFEGSNITSIQFSFDEGFKQQLFSMMNELKELLQEGGETKVFNRYSVEVGDAIWTAVFSHIDELDAEYSIDGIYEEEGQLFAVVADSDENFYRMNFALSDENVFTAEELVEITDSYQASEEPQFSLDAVTEFAEEFAKKKKAAAAGGAGGCGKCAKKKDEEDDDKNDPKDDDKKDDDPEDDDESDDDDEADDKKKKKKYSLEEIPEYTELMSKYSELETKYNDLLSEKENIETELSELHTFKLEVERKDKEEMIAKFYMLTDEDKKDVIDNIDTYSLDEIEAKLCVICVRNKVSLDTENDDEVHKDGVVFSLDNNVEDSSTPAWVKAALAVEKKLNK